MHMVPFNVKGFFPPGLQRKLQSGEKEKNLCLPWTFVQTPAVKRIKLIISKGTNGTLAITRPLGITNQMNQSY